MSGESELDILIVRHGPGRGPHIGLRWMRPAFYDPIVRDIRHRYSGLGRRLRFWYTGAPPPELDRIGAVLFLLQDPVKELFPDCYHDAADLAQRARDKGIRLVNPPEALSNSVKSTQAALWKRAGIPTPDHRKFRDRSELRSLGRGIRFPAIVRADLHHTQRGMTMCPTLEALESIPADRLLFPGTLCSFIDTREGYRETAPGTEWANFYHKKRAMVFGDVVVNNHLFFGPNPIVSSKTCTFSHYRSLNPVHRHRANRRCRKHVEMDVAFFRGPAEHAGLLRRAARALDLDWAAIDYSSMANGELVLWEANPHFALQMWPVEILGRQRRVAERQRRIHDGIARFLEQL